MNAQPLRAGLRHLVQSDGAVILRLVGEDGQSLSVTVTDGRARADAWAILADLDPDEVRAADPVRALAANAWAITPTDAKLLLALEAGHATSKAICGPSGVPTKFLGARLLALRLKGWAVRTDTNKGRGFRAAYAITSEGQRVLGEYREIASQ